MRTMTAPMLIGRFAPGLFPVQHLDQGQPLGWMSIQDAVCSETPLQQRAPAATVQPLQHAGSMHL